MVGLIDACSPEVYNLMTANKRSDIFPISAESWTEHLQSHFVKHKWAFLACYLDDPTYLHGISYLVTSYDLNKFFLLIFQSHPALVAGTGAWTLPFNAATSKHLYTRYPLYILWLPLSRKTFQTWTCSPAQALILYLLLSSNTQRKRLRVIVVRDTLKTFCFPFLVTCRANKMALHLFLSDGVTPHLWNKFKILPLHKKGPTTFPQKFSFACYQWLFL